jgi:hypothetical protein
MFFFCNELLVFCFRDAQVLWISSAVTRRAVLTCFAVYPALPVESNSLYRLTKHNCTGISCYHIGCYRQTELCEASTQKAAARTSTGPVTITLSPPPFIQVQSPHNQFHNYHANFYVLQHTHETCLIKHIRSHSVERSDTWLPVVPSGILSVTDKKHCQLKN